MFALVGSYCQYLNWHYDIRSNPANICSLSTGHYSTMSETFLSTVSVTNTAVTSKH